MALLSNKRPEVNNAPIDNMMRMAELAGRRIEGTITDEERQELDTWLSQSAHNHLLFESMQNEGYRRELLKKMEEKKPALAWSKAKAQLDQERRTRRQKNRYRYLAAAAITVLFCGGWLYLLSVKQKPAEPTLAVRHDVPPGSNKAVLTLANGNQVVLDSNANGVLAQQGNTRIVNLSAGQLAYQSGIIGAEAEEKVQYNTLTTPKGGQYKIILPDGSKVWLNAASSLRYPTDFTGKERDVALNGEAYFEVKHNSAQPFIVKVNGTRIQDIGTAFNIKAYSDGGGMQATLIEGEIKVSTSKASRTLAPGEQATTAAQGEITIRKVNAADAAAWKDGYFVFSNSDLKAVMQTLARWYDVEVQYDKTIPDKHFDGMIQRNISLATVLKYLGKSGIDFQIENRVVTISAAKK